MGSWRTWKHNCLEQALTEVTRVCANQQLLLSLLEPAPLASRALAGPCSGSSCGGELGVATGLASALWVGGMRLCKQRTSVQSLPALFACWGESKSVQPGKWGLFVPPEDSPGRPALYTGEIGSSAGLHGANPAKSLLRADLQHSIFRGGGCFPEQLSPQLP